MSLIFFLPFLRLFDDFISSLNLNTSLRWRLSNSDSLSLSLDSYVYCLLDNVTWMLNAYLKLMSKSKLLICPTKTCCSHNLPHHCELQLYPSSCSDQKSWSHPSWLLSFSPSLPIPWPFSSWDCCNSFWLISLPPPCLPSVCSRHSNHLRVLSWTDVEFCQMIFCIYLRLLFIFLFSSSNVVKWQWLSNVRPALSSWD